MCSLGSFNAVEVLASEIGLAALYESAADEFSGQSVFRPLPCSTDCQRVILLNEVLVRQKLVLVE
jgi:hypothetical protein